MSTRKKMRMTVAWSPEVSGRFLRRPFRGGGLGTRFAGLDLSFFSVTLPSGSRRIHQYQVSFGRGQRSGSRQAWADLAIDPWILLDPCRFGHDRPARCLTAVSLACVPLHVRRCRKLLHEESGASSRRIRRFGSRGQAMRGWRSTAAAVRSNMCEQAMKSRNHLRRSPLQAPHTTPPE